MTQTIKEVFDHSSSMSKVKEKTKSPSHIPLLVWILGCMMFLVNLSYIMVYSYVGIYMKSLGITMGWIGVVEGVAEGCSYLMKLFSGMFSDYLRRRKPVMLVGYSLIVCSRIIFSLSLSFFPLFGARLVERLGNGIQSTPRDTMVADVSPSDRIGTCYGLKRTLAQAGSLVGALCGIGAMIWMDGDYQKVFQIAAVPAIIAFLVLIFFIKEPVNSEHSALSSEIPLPAEKKRTYMHWSNLFELGTKFWVLMILTSIFMLARFGETFLTLHAYTNFGLQAKYAPTIMLMINGGWCLAAYPIGVLADKMNRYWLLIMGIIFLILADYFLASANSLLWIYIGCFLWGVQYGITQNIFLSLIVETVPSDLRGTGFGCYYIICAISAYFADCMAGILSERFGEASAFSASGIIAMVSFLFLVIAMVHKTAFQPKS